MKSNYPTEAELAILQVLWESSPVSVKYVNEILNKEKEVGYTTTLKLMQIMVEKGLLKRKADGKRHLYSPNVQAKAVQKKLVSRFVDATFKGSASALIMQLLGNKKASKAELQEIKDLINQLEKKQK